MQSVWTPEAADSHIAERGCIVSLGQIDAALKRHLEKRVCAGELAKWRAPWNAPFGGFGLAAKTIYGLPQLNPMVSA